MDKLVVNYLGIRASSNLVFHIAILQPYLVSLNISLEYVFLGYSAAFFVGTIAEAPTGAFADRFGRKLSLLLGLLLLSISYFGLYIVANPAQLIAAMSLSALGHALISGADTAILFDLLKSQQRQESYTRWEGWGYIAALICYGGSAATGSVIAEFTDLGFPLVLSALCAFVGIAFVLLLPSNDGRANTSHLGPLGFAGFREVLLLLRTNQKLRYAAVNYVIFAVIVEVGTLLFQPMMIGLGVGIVWFGPLVALLVFVDVAGVSATRQSWFLRLQQASQIKFAWWIFTGFVLLSLLSALLNPFIAVVLGLSAFALHAFGDGLQYPLVRMQVNQEYDGVSRATLISVLAMASGLATSGVSAASGVLIEKFGYWAGFMPLLLLLLWYPKFGGHPTAKQTNQQLDGTSHS